MGFDVIISSRLIFSYIEGMTNNYSKQKGKKI